MFTVIQNSSKISKPLLYIDLAEHSRSMFLGENDPIANMANLASLLYFSLPTINWAGFYLLKHQDLVLGPFHGKPACIRIPIGKGVCGNAIALNKIVIVDDVLEFPGHIACDSDSRSEIVIPLKHNDTIIGVLDIDSPELQRFDSEDQRGLEIICSILIEACDWAIL